LIGYNTTMELKNFFLDMDPNEPRVVVLVGKDGRIVTTGVAGASGTYSPQEAKAVLKGVRSEFRNNKVKVKAVRLSEFLEQGENS